MPESFNNKHRLGHVLKPDAAEDVPTKFKDLDLRFLTMIAMSDTYDGRLPPADGLDYKAILYGNRIAYESTAMFLASNRETRHSVGNEQYLQFHAASVKYLQILKIARIKYFRSDMSEGDDEVGIGKDLLNLLTRHPQFMELEADFGLSLRPTEVGSGFRVIVSKFVSSET